MVPCSTAELPPPKNNMATPLGIEPSTESFGDLLANLGTLGVRKIDIIYFLKINF